MEIRYFVNANLLAIEQNMKEEIFEGDVWKTKKLGKLSIV